MKNRKKKNKRAYRVFGTTQVTVSTVVYADSGAEAISKAAKKFEGIESYVGDGITDKQVIDRLIGVCGSQDTIAADEPITFDDFVEITEVEEL